MIVKVGNWMKNPLVVDMCQSLSSIENLQKHSTPQRCLLKTKNRTIAAIGLEKEKLVVEFTLQEENYALVHGNDYVTSHPLPQMAREGWLLAHPRNEQEIAQVSEWIKKSTA